ncbi:uncharacterized protein LOC131847917 isoform X1 [Achroia grisella]|uniref:uncharacterized protein LOC131847917 isoform X1 n=1 Tax=Achroia grisella TaxID=688607 RepID=UPI0027D302FB|nr:uncharacterized protein LOC131847917 isoform X1 [Achroia grisella]
MTNEEGQPWRCLSAMKSLRDKHYEIAEGENSYVYSRENCNNLSIDKVDTATNIVFTSTPQKGSNELTTVKDLNFIGQGDEDFDIHDEELTQSTSMFINHLFDMSEVERVIIDNEDIPVKITEPDSLTTDISKIMDSCVNAALAIIVNEELQENETPIMDNSSNTNYSCYSFLSDASLNNMDNEIALLTGGRVSMESHDREISQSNKLKETTEKSALEATVDDENKNASLYENAYLTLNRDYEQYSEEDGDPVLQDPKALTLQEVELITAHTSEEDLFPDEKFIQKLKDRNITFAISATASGSRKSSLVHRCRSQGARLLACLRRWWRRKKPGNRKETHVSVRGLCPLSPDARRRAASLLDHSRMRTPSPSRAVIWKFNTVNEAVVNSSRWKKYTFDIKPDECGEYY